jgi:hypothetical protein
MNRAPEDQYEYLDAHPRHVMIPHRLMAYPNDVSLHYTAISFPFALHMGRRLECCNRLLGSTKCLL